MRLTRAVTALVVLSASLAASSPQKRAPDVTLQTADGQPMRLADFKAKVVLGELVRPVQDVLSSA